MASLYVQINHWSNYFVHTILGDFILIVLPGYDFRLVCCAAVSEDNDKRPWLMAEAKVGLFSPEDIRLRFIHAKRIAQRDIDQLVGICEFALKDGIVDQNEAEALLEWLYDHPLSIEKWPANVLFDRLRSALNDGVLDADEQHDLIPV